MNTKKTTTENENDIDNHSYVRITISIRNSLMQAAATATGGL